MLIPHYSRLRYYGRYIFFFVGTNCTKPNATSFTITDNDEVHNYYWKYCSLGSKEENNSSIIVFDFSNSQNSLHKYYEQNDDEECTDVILIYC